MKTQKRKTKVLDTVSKLHYHFLDKYFDEYYNLEKEAY